MNKEEFTEKRRFIVKLGLNLHQYGTPAYSLEAHLNDVAATLNLKGSFVITPTAITFVLWSHDHSQEYIFTARVDPGNPNLGSLAQTHEIVEQISNNELNITEANKALEVIENKKRIYPNAITAIAFALSGGAFATLVRSTLADVALASFLGLIVFFVVASAQYSKRIDKMMEPLSTFITAIIAVFISKQLNLNVNIELAVLSSVIVFIPGLSLTVGLNELSARHLTAGTSRIMDALMQLFKLYFGAFIGLSLAKIWWGPSITIVSTPLPMWTVWVAIGTLCAALVVIFNNRIKDAPFAVLSGFVAYGASMFGIDYFNIALGEFFGAFILGIYCNSFTWFKNAPAAVVSLHGLVVLVPGSKIFIGLDNYITSETIIHVDRLGQQTFLTLMSLVAGFIIANVVLPPKRSL